LITNIYTELNYPELEITLQGKSSLHKVNFRRDE